MKGSPSYPNGVPGVWKAELLQWLAKITGIRMLVETGTCDGFTPWFLQNDFTKIHTIELHQGLYERARKRLTGIPNVFQYLGDSRTFLPYILSIHAVPGEPILFWLDAHASGPDTADAGDPLADEIRIIIEKCPKALIVIDDMHDAELKHVTDAGVNLTGWHKEYRTGEVIMYKEGQYSIPEFEQ